MAEEPLSLHIDNDWKKQAQEEKRRLAEAQEKQRAAQGGNPRGHNGIGRPRIDDGYRGAPNKPRDAAGQLWWPG